MRKTEEDFNLKQKDEQNTFANMNIDISKKLSKIMSTIEDLDIAGKYVRIYISLGLPNG